jgi:hypothetical protein
MMMISINAGSWSVCISAIHLEITIKIMIKINMPSVHLNFDSYFGHILVTFWSHIPRSDGTRKFNTVLTKAPNSPDLSYNTLHQFWIHIIFISNYSFIVLHSCDYPWNLKTFPTAVGRTCCDSLYINYDQWDSWSRVLSTLLTHDPFKNHRKSLVSDLHVKSSILMSFYKIIEIRLRVLTFYFVFLLWPLHYQRLHKRRATFIYFN